MSEIQSLTSEIQAITTRVQDLSRSFSGWNNAYLIFTGFAITLALIAFTLQFVANKISVKLVAAQSELSQLKDKQAFIDSQATGMKIAVLEHANLGMAAKLADSAAQLEDEKKKRLNLAVALLPWIFTNQSGTMANLSKFGPMEAIFEYLDEHEQIAIAEQINFVLSSLNWKTYRRRGGESIIRDGIAISVGSEGSRSFPAFGTEQYRSEAQRLENALAAANVLRDGMGSRINVEVRNSLDSTRGGLLPVTTLLIRIGPQPNPAIDETLKELGPPPNPGALPMGFNSPFIQNEGRGTTVSGNRAPIQELPK